jgi:hypothetical protein
VRVPVEEFNLARTVWSGDDLGAVAQGYSNNVAVGKLTLDAKGMFSTLSFGGTSAGKAIYVEYLQFDNYATNYTTTVSIDAGFTIYFADANVSARKLDGASNGRFRWVPTFVGPNSSTNITYPSGEVFSFNRALVASNDLDSDGDGIPNGFDPTPIFVPEVIGLSVGVTNAPTERVTITWNALALATNRVEFKSTFGAATGWQVLTQFVMGQSTAPVTVTDPAPVGAGQRFYRVRVEPRQ